MKYRCYFGRRWSTFSLIMLASEFDMSTMQSDSAWMGGQVPTGIVTVGDPLLRNGVQAVANLGEVAEIFQRMVALLRQLRGAGLAAPQLGIPLALAVIEVRKTTLFPDRPESPLIQMANPALTQITDERDLDWEGCFSVPGLMGLVPRYRTVHVSYTDPTGRKVTQEHSGYLARVVQHEVDHLEGKLFLDRIESMATLTTVDNYLKFHHSAG
ncbi:MAG: peptide deformylase [Egibacteraceae bacterium]